LKARTVEPLHDTEWDDMVSLHHDSTIFHTAAWARVLATPSVTAQRTSILLEGTCQPTPRPVFHESGQIRQLSFGDPGTDQVKRCCIQTND
jgi:hypothetical protein